MANIINKPRGTQDLIGPKARNYNSIIESLNQTAELYGVQPIIVPMFEESRLFKRGVGESTDIVTKETFDLAGKGGHEYTLRPEFTAGVVRASIENKLYASPDLPIRLYYSGSFFRYERPQTGRFREPHQWGIEFIDQNLDLNTITDAMLLMYEATKSLGIKPIFKLNYIGSSESRAAYREALVSYFTPKIEEMCEDCKTRLKTNPLRILDCKIEDDKKIIKDAPRIGDYLVEEDREKFDKIKAILDALDVEYIEDPLLVRGLDYYTGIVFEIYEGDHLNLGALGGGGQYDGLVKTLGGPEFAGIGFSLGVDRLMLTLDKPETIKGPRVLILNPESDITLFKLQSRLRKEGQSSFMPSASKALGGALKTADRQNIAYVIFKDGDLLKVKDISKREQHEYKEEAIDEIISLIKGE